MSNKSPKNEQNRSSSRKKVTTATRLENTSGAETNQISSEQMEEILKRARQTVKPIIKREMENEVVSEEILGFRMT